MIEGLVGASICAIMLNQVEQFIQRPDAPSLAQALRKLPRPFVDLSKQIENELANLKTHPQTRNNPVAQAAMRRQMKPGYDRARLMAKKLDRTIVALHCIEAIRLHAGQKGKFPESLSEVTDLTTDPVTEKPFKYHIVENKAILSSPAPEGFKPKHAMRYEIQLKQ